MDNEDPGVATAILLVGTGGFIGSVLRHGVTGLAPTTALGTLGVNVLGSFALGIVLSDSRLAARISARMRRFLATGILSSFTTYSTFVLATTELPPPWAAGYVGANYGLAIAAVVLAHATGRWMA